jgi:hypothetical protein
MLEMRNPYNNLAEILGKPERRWDMDIKEKGYEGVDWIHVVEVRDQWWVMNLLIP